MKDRVAIVGSGAGRTALMLALAQQVPICVVTPEKEDREDRYEISRIQTDVLNTVLTKKGLIFPDGKFNRRARREQKKKK